MCLDTQGEFSLPARDYRVGVKSLEQDTAYYRIRPYARYGPVEFRA